MSEKRVLDVCCGSRMMWFDKQNPDVEFCDKRSEAHVLCDGRTLNVTPDTIADFTDLPFPDGSFHLVVMDPPHMLKLGENTWMAQKYGVLLPTWETDLRAGFAECMRVLRPNGVMIFKWNEIQVPLNRILEVIDAKPLFGHTSGKHGRTVWMTFMKDAAA